MTFEFTRAKREHVGILVALAGASGSGKTYSALRLAQGLSETGKIAFIDTEARRGLHYADEFEFLHADMRPPFYPARFFSAVHDAEKAGADVVIIDSFSHEYDGEGGVLDMANELQEKGVKPPGNWKEPKLAHKKLMNALLQIRASIIFCLRADEKIEIIREGGKTQVRPLGWMPICEKRFMFEMTASLTLTPDAPGKVNYDLPHKVQRQHQPFFQHGQVIDENAGKMLREWAAGGEPAPPPVSTVDTEASVKKHDMLIESMKLARSVADLTQWYKDNSATIDSLSEEHKDSVRSEFIAVRSDLQAAAE